MVLAAPTLAQNDQPGSAPEDVHLNERTAECRYVTERARATAATLQWPEFVIQGLRFPDAYGADATTFADGAQVRAGLSVSPSNIVKGARIRALAEAECEARALENETRRGVTDLILQARLAASKDKAKYLMARRDVWRQIEDRARQRLSHHLITRNELADLRRRKDALEAQLVALSGEASMLAARGISTEMGEVAGVGAAMRRYIAAELERERAEADVRRMEAWQLRLSGGVIPDAGGVDWFSMAELRVSIGTFAQNAHLARAQDARRELLAQSLTELPSQLERTQREARALVAQSRRELELHDQQLAALAAEAQTWAGADHEAARHAQDTLVMERIATESERIFLQTLINRLSPLVAEVRNDRR